MPERPFKAPDADAWPQSHHTMYLLSKLVAVEETNTFGTSALLPEEVAVMHKNQVVDVVIAINNANLDCLTIILS